MTDKELRKLSRAQLLELLLEQSREIDRLQSELDQTRRDLEDRTITINTCGSIAEASIAISNVFEEAQKAAEQYLENVKRVIDEKAGGNEALPEISQKRKLEEVPAEIPEKVSIEEPHPEEIEKPQIADHLKEAAVLAKDQMLGKMQTLWRRK